MPSEKLKRQLEDLEEDLEYLQYKWKKGAIKDAERKQDEKEREQIQDNTKECPNCSTELDEKDIRSDGKHPNLGWEYYICPGCKNAIRKLL